jgi:hypothetical protein
LAENTPAAQAELAEALKRAADLGFRPRSGTWRATTTRAT